jgi:hypothetical protein
LSLTTRILTAEPEQKYNPQPSEIRCFSIGCAGCGDGALICRLLSSGTTTPLKSIIGIDISHSTLSRAGNKLQRLITSPIAVRAANQQNLEPQVAAAAATHSATTGFLGSAVAAAAEGSDSLHSRYLPYPGEEMEGVEAVAPAAAVGSISNIGSLSVSLIQADVTSPQYTLPQGWGSLAGCDLVSCVEVLEHLWPESLALLGPCLLGGLQPKRAVFTTPNWEYNKVLRELGGEGQVMQGPPGRDGHPLRHGDHKFEWTRQEFRNWAGGLAAAYGYEVVYEDIGRAVREVGVREGGGEDVGGASQAAIFRRVERGSPDRGHEVGEVVWGPKEMEGLEKPDGMVGVVSKVDIDDAGEHM